MENEKCRKCKVEINGTPKKLMIDKQKTETQNLNKMGGLNGIQ